MYLFSVQTGGVVLSRIRDAEVVSGPAPAETEAENITLDS